MDYIKKYSELISNILDSIPKLDSLGGTTILITGCTGMLCSCVVDVLFYLKKICNYDIVLLLAGRNEERVKSRFEFWQAPYLFVPYDATDNKEISIDGNVDYIIHGASNANPHAYVQEPVETMIANSVGTKVLLDLACKKNARLLYVSSSEVYGRHKGIEAYHEDEYGYIDLMIPRNSYPCSKRFAESLCTAYSAEFGVDFVVVRPGHIYGHTITATDDRASAQFTRNALNGLNIIMKSDGLQLRSYCFVLDCASAVLCVLINGFKNNAYNISNPHSIVTIKEMAEAMAHAAGVRVCYDNPSKSEQKGYSLMTNSSLNSNKLEKLGWYGVFDIKRGTEVTLDLMRSFVVTE